MTSIQLSQASEIVDAALERPEHDEAGALSGIEKVGLMASAG
ncbi:MAG TPA: hypothetical protein VGD53_04235 [Actinoallomurus sp.]